ncbi:hypothetical protein MMC13_003089, partial [Lambiella insularis]|nr:hypothetical protein [Lambiella insularis]
SNRSHSLKHSDGPGSTDLQSQRSQDSETQTWNNPNSYGNFEVHMQYWLSKEMLDPQDGNLIRKWEVACGGTKWCAPYLTVAIRDRTSTTDKREDKYGQLIAAMSIQVYRVYLLSQEAHEKSTFKAQTSNIRHFGILLNGDEYQVFTCQPASSDEPEWSGFHVQKVASDSMRSTYQIRSFVKLVHYIHQWGLNQHKNYVQSLFETYEKSHSASLG